MNRRNFLKLPTKLSVVGMGLMTGQSLDQMLEPEGHSSEPLYDRHMRLINPAPAPTGLKVVRAGRISRMLVRWDLLTTPLPPRGVTNFVLEVADEKGHRSWQAPAIHHTSAIVHFKPAGKAWVMLYLARGHECVSEVAELKLDA